MGCSKKGWKGLWIFRGGHSKEYDISKTEVDILDLTNRWGDNVILQQFTGLYDHDGKEIYEGDIISNNFGTDKEVLREVQWSNGSWVAIRIKGNSRLDKQILLGVFINYNFKIIGNIYQHKYLLGNENKSRME